MPMLIESNYLGDWLKYEADNLYSRDEVVVASGQNLKTGTVIAIVNNKVVQFAPAASDGSNVVAGVLLLDVDASGGDKPGVIIARHAICSKAGLVWPSDATEVQKALGITQLTALGILVREGA
jgi:hypothetical protein